jgi:hypothetical protein
MTRRRKKKDEEIGIAVLVPLHLQRDAGGEETIESDGILDRVGLQMGKALLIGSLIGARKMAGA